MSEQPAIVGIGQTAYYRWGRSPESEFVLALKAIIAAAEDAGLDARAIDGFCSYSNDRNEAARLVAALGSPRARFENMVFGGGGGGACAAVQNAAMAVEAGFANYVAVYRSLAQGQFQRFGQGWSRASASGPAGLTSPYGLMSPAQIVAMATQRYMHQHGIGQDALAAVALAANRHAQRNPNAVMRGRPITQAGYHASRWIVEPFHLFDCCLENDGACAVIVTSAERARDLRQQPAYLLAAAQGSSPRHQFTTYSARDYPTANFTAVAPDLWARAGCGPGDIDVLQSYEDFTGGVLMSIVEHGFCTADEANAFFILENFSAPNGLLPLNTSGGNLAECYMHGLSLVIEGVRQIRGTSTAQVPAVELSMVTGGPLGAPTSSLILRR